MLEEIEMAPRHLFGVIGRTIGGSAGRAGESGCQPCEVDMDIEPLALRRSNSTAGSTVQGEGQAQRQLHQSGIAHARQLHPQTVGPTLIQAWRRARHRQGRCAPRKRGGLRPSLTAAARGRLGVVRPGRRNGPFRPNQETSQVGRAVPSGKGSAPSTHSKRRGGLFLLLCRATGI